MSDSKPSQRAREAWKRFASWYGADVLERKFGPNPPADWCTVLDSLDRETLGAVMADVKSKFPTWMPGLPEFEAIVQRIRRPYAGVVSAQEQLVDYVLRNYRLTPSQLRAPWRFLHAGQSGFAGVPASHDYRVAGVIVPADDDQPGYRVLVEDMQLGNAA